MSNEYEDRPKWDGGFSKQGFSKQGFSKQGFSRQGFDRGRGFGRKDEDYPMTTLLNPADQDCPRAWRKLFK